MMKGENAPSCVRKLSARGRAAVFGFPLRRTAQRKKRAGFDTAVS